MSEERRCRTCSVLLTKKPGPGRWPHWCEGCRRTAAAKIERVRYESNRIPRTYSACEECGGRVRELNGGRRTRFCYATECRKAAAAAHYRESYTPPAYDKTCETCGTAFVAKNSGRMYCSRPCGSRAYAIKRREDGRAGDNTARRRALEKGASLSPGRRRNVLVADGYCCRLCGLVTNPTSEFPAWDYPVIDHIIPLARGGEHGPGNWQTAHHYCNSRKSDMSMAQFRKRFPCLTSTVSELALAA